MPSTIKRGRALLTPPDFCAAPRRLELLVIIMIIENDTFLRHIETGRIGLAKKLYGAAVSVFRVVDGDFVFRIKANCTDERDTWVWQLAGCEIVPEHIADPRAACAQLELF